VASRAGLGALARLSGRILGGTPEQVAEARVVAVPVGDGACLAGPWMVASSTGC
jgi:hypothetical protein